MSSPLSETQLRKRLKHILQIFCLLFCILGYYAFRLQIVTKQKFDTLVKNSQFLSVTLPGIRGHIRDRHGHPLAISVKVFSLGLNPRLLKSRTKSRLARKLARILKLSSSKVMKRLLEDRYFVRIKRHLNAEEIQALVKLGTEHRDFQNAHQLFPDSRRFYPNHHLASHILGYTDRDGKGLAGVEYQYEKLLKGTKKVFRLAHDPKGRRLLRPGAMKDIARWGANVELTIDKTIQFITERALAKAVKQFKAVRGTAVVLSPKSGDILAMAVAPDFDPNKFREVAVSTRANWAVSMPYEPGSTMKPVTLAIARHLNKLRWTERIHCENGRMKIGRYTIHDDHPQGLLTPLEVIKYSSNICTAKIARRIGKKAMHKFFQMFGFGRLTQVGLPWESRGIMSHYKKWAKISLANIAFGQGIAVTPLQLTASINAIASGGLYRKPRLYRKIVDRNNKIIHDFRKKPIHPDYFQKCRHFHAADDGLRGRKRGDRNKGCSRWNCSGRENGDSSKTQEEWKRLR